MQVVDGQARYWHSYGTRLEQLPTLQEYAAEKHKDKSRNANPGEICRQAGICEQTSWRWKSKYGSDLIPCLTICKIVALWFNATYIPPDVVFA
jgi:hypothetical protein